MTDLQKTRARTGATVDAYLMTTDSINELLESGDYDNDSLLRMIAGYCSDRLKSLTPNA